MFWNIMICFDGAMDVYIGNRYVGIFFKFHDTSFLPSDLNFEYNIILLYF